MTVAIDFDGTLCYNAFPEIGDPNIRVIKLVKLLKFSGVKLILWTCRNGEYLDAAVKWCKEHGLEFDAVNENLKETQECFGGDTRKVWADLYLDDKNVGGLAVGALEDLIMFHLSV